MKEKKMESMPVASRSRKQTELREKELREKNKRARLAARNEYWRKNAEKMRNPSLGGGGDDDEENVIVADESVYLKRKSMVGEKESSQDVDASLEETSDDSVQIVGERWNPLGAGFDNNEDGDDVDGVACDFQPGLSKVSSKGCTDHGVDNQSSPMDVASEDIGGDSDGLCHSSHLESSENDDKVSDEDFLVDEVEMHTVYSSVSSQDYSAYASEKAGNWKGRTSGKKINQRFSKDDIQSRAGIDEEILTSDEFDEEYLQSLKEHYGSSSKQRKNAEIFGRSVKGGNRKRGRPPKNRSAGFEYKAEDRAMSENYDSSGNGSFIQSSPLLHHSSSKNGATKKRGRPRTYTSEIIRSESESESENDPIGVFAKSENGGNRKRERVPHFEEIGDEADEHYLEWLRSLELSVRCGNAGNKKRGRPPKGMNVGVDSKPEDTLQPMDGYRRKGRPPKKTIVETESESENDLVGEFGDDIEDGDELYMQWLRDLELSGRCENGGNSKRGRPPNRMNVGVGSGPENDGHQQRGQLPKNGGYGKRGRPPKNWNKGFDSETGYKRGRGRPRKNWNKRFDSEEVCKRSRGRPRNVSRI